MHKFNPDKLAKLNNPRRTEIFPIEDVVEKAGLINPEVIIDIGAGTGFFSIQFAQKFKNSTIYACDVLEVMVEWMKTNIGMYQNVVPTKMEDSTVPLDDESADLLFMVNVHHELDYPDKTLRECYRLLKNGGKIAISDWKKEESEHGPELKYRKDHKEVREQLESTGFTHLYTSVDLPNNFLVIGKKT